MKKEKKKIGKRTVEVHKMEGLYPYVRLEDFMKVCKGLEEENQKLKSEGVVIGGEDHKNYIDFEEYLKLKRENEKLKKKLSKREQGEYRYFGNDGEQDIYEITSIKDGPITYRKDSTGKWVADGEPPYVLC